MQLRLLTDAVMPDKRLKNAKHHVWMNKLRFRVQKRQNSVGLKSSYIALNRLCVNKLIPKM